MRENAQALKDGSREVRAQIDTVLFRCVLEIESRLDGIRRGDAMTRLDEGTNEGLLESVEITQPNALREP